MGKHFPLSLLTPYLLSLLWQSPHQCGVHIGLYTLSSRRVLHMGYCIAKGVSKRCIARLLLTFHFIKKVGWHASVPRLARAKIWAYFLNRIFVSFIRSSLQFFVLVRSSLLNNNFSFSDVS